MICKICNNEVKLNFNAKILNKYDVEYFRCNNCEYVFTENPFWLNEAYNSAITALDIGLLNRNIKNTKLVEWLINNYLNPNSKFLDYAGGYGVFVRLMRDTGFDFYRSDLYCENLFANGFDEKDLNSLDHFELITAFEFFEHLDNPLIEFKKLIEKCDYLLFTTELNNYTDDKMLDWWYMSFETGQHISFYTQKTLEFLANKFGLYLYTDSVNTHLFSKIKFKINPLIKYRKINNSLIRKLLTRIYSNFFIEKNNSLLQKDYNTILKSIR